MDFTDPTGQVRVSFDDGAFSGVAINQSWQRHLDDFDALGTTIAAQFRQALSSGGTPPTTTVPSVSVEADPTGVFRVALDQIKEALAAPRPTEQEPPPITTITVGNGSAEHVGGWPTTFAFDPEWAEGASAVQLSQAATRVAADVWQAALDHGLTMRKDDRDA